MKDLYNIEEILLQIFPKQNEYFLPIALYIKDRKTNNSFLIQGIHCTYKKWEELSKPRTIKIKKYVNIYRQYSLLWDIDIRSKSFYLFSEKHARQGYNLLINRCVFPQFEILKSRLKELNPDSDLYKYNLIIQRELYKILSDLMTFIQDEPRLIQALENDNKYELNVSEMPSVQKNNDILKPIPIRKITHTKESKDATELKKSKLDGKITGDEAFALLKKLEDRDKPKEADNYILQNKSFPHWSSEYIKKNFSQELFDEAFEELKLEEILEYSNYVFLTNPPSRWYEKKFINSFIFHCNHSKGRYYYKKNKKKFEYDRNKNVDGKKKKCFLLKNT